LDRDQQKFEHLIKSYSPNWQEAVTVPLPTFFNHYTLHDSRWIGLYREENGQGIAVFRWDVVWQDGKIPYHEGGMEQAPLLFVKLETLLNAYCIDGIEPLPSISSNTISHAFSEVVMGRHGECYFTEMELDYGNLQIVHQGETWLFCMNYKGEPIPIPF
jgi:hypothetical protein